MSDWQKQDGQGREKHKSGTILFSGPEKHHARGVGILMSQRAKKALIGYEPVSDRIITARFCGQPMNTTFVQTYAPTADSSEEELEAFYTQLQECMDKIPQKDVRVIAGDWNAKVGEDRTNLENIMGKHGYGERNHRGERLLEFARANEPYVCNTKFKHKVSRKWTWEAPNGRDKNMIDLIMINRRWASSVRECRSFPGADISSDHNLVLCNVRIALRRRDTNSKPIAPFDVSKLENLDTANAYRQAVDDECDNLELSVGINTALEQVTTALKKVATKILGTKRKTRKPWISTETLNLADEKEQLARRDTIQPHYEERIIHSASKPRSRQRETKPSGSRSSAGRYKRATSREGQEKHIKLSAPSRRNISRKSV